MMMIKIVIILSSLLINLSINCKGQEYDSINLKLPGYQVDSCLSQLLATVAQSNKQYYSTDQYFYSLTLKEGKRSEYISITPDMWSEARHLDYTGILKISNVTFLFRGDFQHNSIFKRSPLPQTEVKLRQEKSGSDKEAFFIEPSLQGAYYECKGKPIYIEVYTKGKILNFEMKVRPSKS